MCLKPMSLATSTERGHGRIQVQHGRVAVRIKLSINILSLISLGLTTAHKSKGEMEQHARLAVSVLLTVYWVGSHYPASCPVTGF